MFYRYSLLIEGGKNVARIKKFTNQQLWEATKQLLLKVGYDAFTVSLLAESMNVSRAAIYKYYPNKEELIAQFMLEKMEQTVASFSMIDPSQSFEHLFKEILIKIFDSKDLHQILGYASKINNVSDVVIVKKEKLSNLHHEMFRPLLKVVAKGKEENIIAQNKDDFLIVSFIFSTINVQNHSGLNEVDFMLELEQFILYGITKK